MAVAVLAAAANALLPFTWQPPSMPWGSFSWRHCRIIPLVPRWYQPLLPLLRLTTPTHLLLTAALLQNPLARRVRTSFLSYWLAGTG